MYQPIKFLKNWFDYYRNTEDEELLYDIDGLPVDLQSPFSSVSTEDEIFVSPDNKCYNCKEVVDDIFSESTEILINEAKKINKKADIGDEVSVEFIPTDFGRIAAQSAKQVISQRVREAEKNRQYQDFIDKQNQIVSTYIEIYKN